MKVITKNAQETILFGKNFAKKLRPGEVVLLIGDLGSGKTTFVKGVARGLGVKEVITSPTFVILKTYKIRNPKHEIRNKSEIRNSKFKIRDSNLFRNSEFDIRYLVHIDTYRGLDIMDLANIGALEYLGRKDSVCLIEWGAGLEKYLKSKKIKTKKVKIKAIDENERIFNIKTI